MKDYTERRPAETLVGDADFRIIKDHPAHLIRRSYQVFLCAFDEAMAGLPLSPASWIIIATVRNFPSLSVTEVARRAAIDKASCGRTASALERRGLLSIKKSNTDGREKLLDITPAGEELYGKAFIQITKLRSLLLDEIDPEVQRQFLTSMAAFVYATRNNTRPSIPTARDADMD